MDVATILMPVASVLVAGALACWLMLDRRHVRYLLFGAGVAAVFLLCGFLSLDVENQDLVVLQAGLSHVNVRHVFGLGNHFCATCIAFPEVMAKLGSHGLPIQDMVLANRILTAINIAGLAVLAMKVTRSWLYSLLYVAVTFLLPIVAMSSDSNYSATGLTSLMLAIILCAAVFCERSRLGSLAVVVSMPALAAATVLAGLSRPEMAVPGLVAICLTVVRMSPLDQGISSFAARISALWKPPVSESMPDRKGRRRGRIAVLVTFSLSVVGIWGFCAILRGTAIPVWVIDGLDPLHRTLWTAPGDILRVVPAPLAILVFAGLWRTSLHPIVNLGLPFSLIFLVKTASSAGTDGLQTFTRMMATVAPLMMIAGVWALRDIHRWSAEKIGPVWTRLVLSGVIAGSLFINPGFVRDYVTGPATDEARLSGLAGPGSMLNRDSQLEVRFLADALDSHPDCLFVTKAYDQESYRSISGGEWPHLMKDVWFTRSGEMSLPPRIEDDECVLFYRSLDCNNARTNECDAIIDDAIPVQEVSLPGTPYGSYLKATYVEPVVLGLYMLRKP